MFELLSWKKEDWDFVGKRRIAFVVSGILCAVGLTAILQLAMGKASMGIDFAGGLSMNVALEKRIDIDTIRGALEQAGIKEAQIQDIVADSGQRLLIKLRDTEQEADVTRVMNELAGEDNPVVIEGVQAVGPAIGARLRKQAAKAVAWAIVLITVYIWIRFEYRFGVAAAVATVHDVLVVLGLMWALGRDFNMLTVTALLTLAGYSLNDTVVVFDRIRENLRLRNRENLSAIINSSINEILSRSIVTTLTTSVVLFAIYLYGSQVTEDFSLALILGIVVGTYSSWFVASPIIVEWELYRRKRAEEAAISRLGQK